MGKQGTVGLLVLFEECVALLGEQLAQGPCALCRGRARLPSGNLRRR